MAGLIGAGTYRLVSQDGLIEKDITIDNSGNPLFDNNKLLQEIDIRSNLNASGDAPIYACRAWVNFNGTGTVAIRSSGNVSSITDNGTGSYRVNFTTAMPDANYAVSGWASDDATMGGFFYEAGTNQSTRTTSYFNVIWSGHSGAAGDRSLCTFVVFR